MKIGFVLDDGLDKPDGVQQYILTLGRWFAENNHEVHYIVGETSRTDIPNTHSMSKNVTVSFNGNKLTVPLPANTRKIKNFIKSQNFDVLHIQVPYSPFMGAKVIRSANSKTAVVGTFHILPYGWMSRIGTRFLGLVLKKNLKRFDAIASVSAPAAEFAKTFTTMPTEIVPNSVNIEKFRLAKLAKQKDGSFKILFLGRLVQRKGCHKLLEALSILQQADKLPTDIQLDICGAGPDRPKLEKFVKVNGLSGIVHFRGFISEPDKIKFMQNADLSVFPSLSGESFGIVLIEAMAEGGGAVLGGDNPGYRSVLADIPESIIDAADPDIFAKQLEFIIRNDSERLKIIDKQKRHVEQFNTPVVATRLLNLYQACIQARRNG